jgi:hypothetical protein
MECCLWNAMSSAQCSRKNSPDCSPPLSTTWSASVRPPTPPALRLHGVFSAAAPACGVQAGGGVTRHINAHMDTGVQECRGAGAQGTGAQGCRDAGARL